MNYYLLHHLKVVSIWLLFWATFIRPHNALTPASSARKHYFQLFESSLTVSPSPSTASDGGLHRRRFLTSSAAALGSYFFLPTQSTRAATTPPSLATTLDQLQQARNQLNPIPELIQQEKWDAVRNILITPPLSDCWSKTSKLLSSYADAIGANDKDELAALELKEDAVYHLRFLDMAVYNNVFNPIKSEGTTGATKELVKSYYEDPPKEYQACVQILDQLIQLAKQE